MEDHHSTINNVSKHYTITKLRHNDAIVEDEVQLADIFNNYFSLVGFNLARHIPSTYRLFHHYLGERNESSIFFSPTYPQEILKIMSGLKINKSAGFDEIDNNLLQKTMNYIVDPLVYIFNLSLLSGHIPESMKISKIIPIFKKGDSTLTSNYRPISLRTTLSKILETLVRIRTMSFFKKHNILSDTQFGFREKSSTTHAILSLVQTVAKAIDQSSNTVGLFIDFSKAFYTVDHDVLLYKLSHYGIREKTVDVVQELS